MKTTHVSSHNTTTVQHKMPEEYLFDYAAGTLSSGQMLLVESYLQLNPTDKSTCDIFENLCGSLFTQAMPENGRISQDALLNTLDRIDMLEQSATANISSAEVSPTAFDQNTDTILPSALQRIFAGNMDTIQWQKLSAGVEQAPIRFADDTKITARLMRIQPQTRVPEHAHKGTEMTLVLDGGFEDGERQYNRGDVCVIHDPNIHHHPFAHSEKPCICLVVNTDSIRLTGFWGRLLNPFLKF